MKSNALHQWLLVPIATLCPCAAAWSSPSPMRVPFPSTFATRFEREQDSDEGKSILPQVEVQARIVAALKTIEIEEEEFFNQLELSIARKTYSAMMSGAETMVDQHGSIDIANVDEFHNNLDKFQRAMGQLQSGPMPANSDYGTDANEAAKALKKPMKTAELKRVGKAVSKELKGIKELANETPGLEALDLKQKCETMPDFVTQVHRVVRAVEVMTGRRVGLGPRFKRAAAEAEPLRKDVLKLAQAANALLDDGVTRKSDAVSEFEGWLEQAIKDAEHLGKKAHVWRKEVGPRVVESLESLDRASKSVRAKLARS